MLKKSTSFLEGSGWGPGWKKVWFPLNLNLDLSLHRPLRPCRSLARIRPHVCL